MRKSLSTRRLGKGKVKKPKHKMVIIVINVCKVGN